MEGSMKKQRRKQQMIDVLRSYFTLKARYEEYAGMWEQYRSKYEQEKASYEEVINYIQATKELFASYHHMRQVVKDLSKEFTKEELATIKTYVHAIYTF
jgi:hypothetical protein